MRENRNSDRDELDTAYAGIKDGVSGVLSECAVFGRYLWNIQMRLLKSIGVMPFFVSHWWLFWILGFVLLAFAMPLGVAFLATAFAAGQMGPKSQNDFIVPLRQDNRQGQDLSELTSRQADKLQEYGDKMGAFKDATLDWVISEHGSIIELPKDISLALSMYLIEASTAACKRIGIHEDLHESTHLNLLGQLGFPPDFALGMLHAAMTNPFKDDGAAAGEAAYNDWERDGAKAAISNIEKAFSNWNRTKNLSDELSTALR